VSTVIRRQGDLYQLCALREHPLAQALAQSSFDLACEHALSLEHDVPQQEAASVQLFASQQAAALQQLPFAASHDFPASVARRGEIDRISVRRVRPMRDFMKVLQLTTSTTDC
jgi:hypothetical protein